jgi:hypothetical protein
MFQRVSKEEFQSFSYVLVLSSLDYPDIHQTIIHYPSEDWKEHKNFYYVRRKTTTKDRKLTMLQTEQRLSNTSNVTLADYEMLEKSDNVTIATYQVYGEVGKRNDEVKVIATKKSPNPKCNPVIYEDKSRFCLESCNLRTCLVSDRS